MDEKNSFGKINKVFQFLEDMEQMRERIEQKNEGLMLNEQKCEKCPIYVNIREIKNTMIIYVIILKYCGDIPYSNIVEIIIVKCKHKH